MQVHVECQVETIKKKVLEILNELWHFNSLCSQTVTPLEALLRARWTISVACSHTVGEYNIATDECFVTGSSHRAPAH
jgi:hypothetical protein